MGETIFMEIREGITKEDSVKLGLKITRNLSEEIWGKDFQALVIECTKIDFFNLANKLK